MRERTWADALFAGWGSRARIRVWGGIWAALLLTFVVIASALTLPRLVDEQGRVVSVVGNGEFLAIRSTTFEKVGPAENEHVAMNGSPAWSLPLTDLARLEEPDVLDGWDEYRQFVQVIDLLNRRVAQSTQLELVRGNGRVVSVHVEKGSLSLLGWRFWLQMATSLFCAATSELTWRLARQSSGLLGYRLAGWGVAFAAWASALYATRSIGLSAELFEVAHALNTVLGGPLFGAGLCMLLVNEPRQLMRRPALWLLGIPLTALAWWARVPGLGPALSGYSSILFYTLAILVLLGVQRFSLRSAIEQAIWRWMTLAVVSGIVFFVLAQALPVALGMRPLASQTMTLVGFAWLFGLLSLGASRYRLFAVARYWGRTWKWLAATAALIALDLIVVAFLPGKVGTHSWLLIVALAWLYFPLRQLLAERLSGPKRGTLLDGARRLSHATTEVDLLRRFEEELGRYFETVEINVAGATSEVALAQEGETLIVPWPRGEASFVLRHKRGGRFLFDMADLEEARAYLGFARNLLEARDAYSRGEADERQRVRRDLHDHLGARLSRLALVSDDVTVAREIAHLTRELRQITAALTGDSISLEMMLMELESETRAAGRVHSLPVNFSTAPGLAAWEINVEAQKRSDWIAFIRESLENAGRHALKGGEVQVEIQRQGAGLFLRVTSLLDPNTQSEPRTGGFGLGAGLLNLRRRAQLSGGRFTADLQEKHFVTSLWSPLSRDEKPRTSTSSVRRVASELEHAKWQAAQ